MAPHSLFAFLLLAFVHYVASEPQGDHLDSDNLPILLTSF